MSTTFDHHVALIHGEGALRLGQAWLDDVLLPFAISYPTLRVFSFRRTPSTQNFHERVISKKMLFLSVNPKA